ncbi:Y55_G0052410.mRNA.1.CDS.1 [Saccharomyces cerevisiae]|nr:Y55_G0052410.mRNA.1.CDS.1 [Saccharomyces cerevisiae]
MYATYQIFEDITANHHEAFRSNKISMAIDIAQPFPRYTSRTVAARVLCLFRVLFAGELLA